MCSGQQEIWEMPGDSKVEVNLRITSLENSNKSEVLSCSIFDSEDLILILDIRIIIIIIHWIIAPTFSTLCSQEHNCKQCHYSSLTAPDSFHWPALPAEPISLRPNPFFNWRPEVTEFWLYIHTANERAGPQEGEAKKKIVLHKWKIAENINSVKIIFLWRYNFINFYGRIFRKYRKGENYSHSEIIIVKLAFFSIAFIYLYTYIHYNLPFVFFFFKSIFFFFSTICYDYHMITLILETLTADYHTCHSVWEVGKEGRDAGLPRSPKLGRVIGYQEPLFLLALFFLLLSGESIYQRLG